MSVTMFDSTDVGAIPRNAKAVAGYTAGRWPTFPQLVKLFPNAHRLSIAVKSADDADCLDVEPGDATNAVAPVWVHRQKARGLKYPVVYTSVSNAQPLLDELAKDGIPRSGVRLWTAHYTEKAHICGPGCGFGLKEPADGTQWTSHALGRNLDQSLLRDDFFGAKADAAEAKKQRAWRQHRAGAQRQINRARDYIRKLNRLIGRKR